MGVATRLSHDPVRAQRRQAVDLQLRQPLSRQVRVLRMPSYYRSREMNDVHGAWCRTRYIR